LGRPYWAASLIRSTVRGITLAQRSQLIFPLVLRFAALVFIQTPQTVPLLPTWAR